jgi:uncharacterized membrane protein
LLKNILNGLSRGRLFGHPVHIMLVHFPIALFPMGAVLDAASLYFKDPNLSIFSFYSIAAGAVTGWTALIFGAMDLLKISPENKAFSIGLLHGGLNLLWLFIFSISAGIEFSVYPNINLPSTGKLIAEFFAAAGMFYPNYLGGVLLLKYDVGKEKSRITD